MSTKQQSDLATALQSPTQYSKPQNEVQETKMEESLYDPLRNSPKSGSKTVHIRSISLKKESGYYSEIRSKLRRLQMPLWNSSATTWTRDASPSHRVPKAYRQTIGDINLRRTTRWILKLDTTRNISNPEKGMGFAKSTRIEHFFDKNRTSEPSAQSYHQHRYMDNSHYKMPQLSQTKQPGQTQMLKTLQSCILDSIVSDKNRNAEQKTEVSLTKVMESYLNTPTIEQPRRFDELKGRTFSKQEKPTHRYYDHAHRFAYNESFTIDYPGAGSYNTSLEFAKDKPKYSIRKVLGRCFDTDRLEKSPSPCEYYPNDVRPGTTSTRGTFQNSHRLDLAKPLNQTPGPAFYNPVEQTIEKKCRPRDVWSSHEANRGLIE